MRVVSIDGEIVSAELAMISVFDRGLLYGDGLFEVLRTWNGRAALLDDHLDRLYASAATLALHVAPRDRVASWVRAAIAAAGEGEHRVRVIATRGPGPLGARLATLTGGRVIAIVEPLPEQPSELALAIVDWPLPRRAEPALKTLAYLDHIIARELAAAAGADEAVRLDADGDAIEGATSNLFTVTGGAVATPSAHGALPGITRARVLALCGELGIPAAVRRLPARELRAADEVFATSSLRGVVPVTRLDGAPRAAGPITRRIADAYAHAMRSLL
jgi:branched-chain amino acid aminotransferase